MKAISYTLSIICLFFFLGFQSGCKKFNEVGSPATSVNAGNVYLEDATASAVVTGIYAKMVNNSFSANFSIIPELSADNLNLFDLSNGDYVSYYQNVIIANYPTTTIKFWSNIYPLIFSVNAAIEGLNQSTTLTTTVKQRLLGECYFLRGFFYFYLVNFYGEVPLVLGTNYNINSRLARSSTDIVYQQILNDLNQAKPMLDNNYVDATLINTTNDRVRPNKMAVDALLARVYLYLKKYNLAETSATEVINQTSLYSSSIPLDQVFLKNSKETIWALQPVQTSLNTAEGNIFVLPSSGPNAYFNLFYLTANLNSIFESSDQRKTTWIKTVIAGGKTYPYSFKYKVVRGTSDVSEYSIVFRLAEQILIRSEARAAQGNIQGSQDDLNLIRQRAGLGQTTASNQTDLFAAILKERRTELFCEWGHRWLDLKRTGNIDSVMQAFAPIKNGQWQSYKALYPVPLSEIKLDNLLTQNPGYN